MIGVALIGVIAGTLVFWFFIRPWQNREFERRLREKAALEERRNGSEE